MISTWDQRLAEQAKRQFKNYKVLVLDLSIARTNQGHPLPGDCLYVIEADTDALMTVRLNANTNEELSLRKHRKIETVFTIIYISNAAQSGKSMTLLAGTECDIEDPPDAAAAEEAIEEVQPCFTVTNASAGTDTTAAAHAAKRALIIAHTANTGLVWVNFGAAAVAGSCHPLAAGDSVTVPLTNTNKIHALFVVANEKVTVDYVIEL